MNSLSRVQSCFIITHKMLFLFYIVLHVSNLVFGGKDNDTELQRYIRDDLYKMPIFGSFIYDPIKQEFEDVSVPIPYKKHNATTADRPTTTTESTPGDSIVIDIRTTLGFRKHVGVNDTAQSVEPGGPLSKNHSLHKRRYREHLIPTNVNETYRKIGDIANSAFVNRGREVKKA